MVEVPFPLLTLLQPKSYPALLYEPGYLPYSNYRIFTADISGVSSLLSSLFSLHLPNYSYVRSLRFSYPVEQSWSFKDHLPPTRPTENIFNLLESLRSESLLRRYPAELVFDMLNVVIKWLEVSFRQLDTPQTNLEQSDLL